MADVGRRIAGTGAFALMVLVAQFAGAAEPCTDPVAHVVSVQGEIEIARTDPPEWQRVVLDHPVCAGDLLRAGPRSRAAVMLLHGDGVLRLDQSTTLRIVAAPSVGASLLELLQGAIHAFARRPRSIGIDTPFVNAAVEGTEFVVEVADRSTRITVLQGRVRASNALGEVVLASGESAQAGAGEPPRARIEVRPRDAVRWALHYPPVLVLSPDPARPTVLDAVLARWQAGDTEGAYDLLDDLIAREAAAEALVLRAAFSLARGRVDEAAHDIDLALARAADLGAAHALRAIVAVARNDVPTAQIDAGRAVALAPNAPAAHIAHSYALQAAFRLDEAQAAAERAVAVAPENALAWARLAEMRLAQGETTAAGRAAERAAALDPDLARARLMQGFAALAGLRMAAAAAGFERAVALDSADPQGRLGLGLARIRTGDLAGGRRELEIAAALDPDDALLRSHLGKAFVEERRDDLAEGQFDLARALDPNDPTPWFYDAVRKHQANRPIEALADLERAIALNDDRAVFRSRLLLDEDLAMRGARLGGIYRDLGFERLALLQGRQALEHDPANHSAHRLLADNYLGMPRHQIARDSELLQSQLLQPLALDPVQPRLAGDGFSVLADAGPAEAGLGEYGRLFVADGFRLLLDGLVGEQDTVGGSAILSGIYGRLSFSLGHERVETDGIRANHDLRDRLSNVFLQVAATPDTSLQAELRHGDRRTGDRDLLFDPANFSETRRDRVRTRSARIGLRHRFAPHAVLIGSYGYRELDGNVSIAPFFSGDEEEKVHFLELRHLHRLPGLNATVGVGSFRGEREDAIAFGGAPPIPTSSDIRHDNLYGYADLALPRNLTLVLGASVDLFDAAEVERDQVNPKLGLVWRVRPDTTLRAALFRTLKRTVISGQTLEPTQVASFEQFYDDINGTDAWRFGVGLDHRVGRRLHMGAQVSGRELKVPVLLADPPPPRPVRVDAEEREARAWIYWTPTDRVAASAEYRFERFEQDPMATPYAFSRSRTHRLSPELRWFHPSGAFTRLRATFVRQDGLFGQADGTIARGEDDFWTADAALGWRFPGRRGQASIEIRNILDEDFRFQDSLPSDATLLPERTVLARLQLVF